MDHYKLTKRDPKAHLHKNWRVCNFRTNFRKEMFRGGDVFCAYCCSKLTYKEATIDHVVSLIDNGRDCYANYLISCEPCNKQKGWENQRINKIIRGPRNCFQCGNQHKFSCPLSKKKENLDDTTTIM
jgi:5-methylcytosine-specific restriction endonuclease McrA